MVVVAAFQNRSMSMAVGQRVRPCGRRSGSRGRTAKEARLATRRATAGLCGPLRPERRECRMVELGKLEQVDAQTVLAARGA